MRIRLALLAFLSGLSLLRAQDDPNCQASVEISGAGEVASSVRARLVVPGHEVVYIPRIPGGVHGYLVERVERPPGGPTASQMVEFAIHSLQYPPTPYRLSDPPLLPVDWREVLVDSPAGALQVPAGKYRLSILFAIDDPSKSKEKEKVRVCRAYSPPFDLARAQSWSTHE